MGTEGSLMCLGSIAIGPDPEPYKISPLTSLTRFHYYSFSNYSFICAQVLQVESFLGGFRSNSLCIPLLFHKCQILRKKYYFALLNTVHLGSASEKIEFRAIFNIRVIGFFNVVHRLSVYNRSRRK